MLVLIGMLKYPTTVLLARTIVISEPQKYIIPLTYFSPKTICPPHLPRKLLSLEPTKLHSNTSKFLPKLPLFTLVNNTPAEKFTVTVL